MNGLGTLGRIDPTFPSPLFMCNALRYVQNSIDNCSNPMAQTVSAGLSLFVGHSYVCVFIRIPFSSFALFSVLHQDPPTKNGLPYFRRKEYLIDSHCTPAFETYTLFCYIELVSKP